jgi:hypothetical protein
MIPQVDETGKLSGTTASQHVRVALPGGSLKASGLGDGGT